MAAAAVLSGSFGATLGQGTDGSGRMSTAPVIAQQVVDVPVGSVAFIVTEQTIDADGFTISGTGPSFLVGTEGAALVKAEAGESVVLLGSQEATALAADRTYQVEPLGDASLLGIELRWNAPDSASTVSGPFSDIAGLRDMELRRAEIGQQNQMIIDSESGAGLLVVLEGTVLVEDPFGASALVAAGNAIELDESTPVTGIDPESVVLAVTLGEELTNGSGNADEGDAAPNLDDVGSGGSAGNSQPGSSGPAVQVDTDGDGLYDDEEGAFGSDPNNIDSDQDGLSDGDEVHTYGSSPTSMDTDGDMLPDYNEVMQQGTDPANSDTDGDGLSDQTSSVMQAPTPRSTTRTAMD